MSQSTWTNSVDGLERLRLVSSLYGPGNTACWLLIVSSVLISWTVNQKTRDKDSITNDLIAALTFPAVAAGHLAHQLIFYPGDRSEILITQNPALVPQVAAIEACLNVCETFSLLAIVLFVIAALKLQGKRCLAVFLVGFFCFGTECALFILSPNSTIQTSNFTRPFILNENTLMIVTFSLAGLLMLASQVVWWIHYYKLMKTKESTNARQNNGDPAADNMGILLQRLNAARWRGDQDAIDEIDQALQRAQQRQRARDGILVKALAWVTLFTLPGATVASIATPLGAWGVTALGSFHSFTWRLKFFLPVTASSFTDLDQVVAFFGGLVTLLFSCYAAIKPRLQKEEGQNRRL